VTEVLLHLLVVSPFIESLAVGDITVGRVLAAVALLAVLLHLIARPDARALPEPWVGLAVACLTLWLAAGLWWAPTSAGWLTAVTMHGLAVCYFLAYALLIGSRDQLRRLLVTYLCAALASAVLGIVQAQTGARAVGLQGDANTYALYELCAIPIAARLAAEARGPVRYLWLSGAVLLVGAVMASQSRGGLIATVVVLLLILSRGDIGGSFTHRRALATTAALSLSAGLVALAVTTIPRLSPEQASEGGGTGRLDIWRTAWLTWEEHPFLGIGPGNFEPLSSQLLSQTPGVQLDPNSVLFEGIRVHNSYLEPWVEMGPVGFLCYLAVLGTTAWVLARERRVPFSGVLSACLPMLVGFAVATFFISAMNNKLLWMLVGIAAALPHLRTSRTRPPTLAVASEDA
jgi:O-antigen ligase